ncbi:unnamed protein product [Coregonus sp. 'balchen']|nr:unnamed protein product [Coregonus sp. 'balchen']
MFPTMQLETHLHLCQSCLWCCKSGLRLLSQSSVHRKLECVHNNFMDEKDGHHTDLQRVQREGKVVNGFKKQTEILKQKHAEFLEKYKITRNSGEGK